MVPTIIVTSSSHFKNTWSLDIGVPRVLVVSSGVVHAFATDCTWSVGTGCLASSPLLARRNPHTAINIKISSSMISKSVIQQKPVYRPSAPPRALSTCGNCFQETNEISNWGFILYVAAHSHQLVVSFGPGQTMYTYINWKELTSYFADSVIVCTAIVSAYMLIFVKDVDIKVFTRSKSKYFRDP